MKIYKYHVPLTNKFVIDMPLNAEILSFQEQKGEMFLWAVIDPDIANEERKFCLFGTGHDIDMDSVKKFIGTVQMCQCHYVWHLFEMKE